MSTPNPVLHAAAPELIAMIQAVSAMVTTMGPDPSQWAIKFPGALLSLNGAILSQLPTLAAAEGSALQATINNTLAGWVTSLKGA